jgi:predicted DNA binding CopG/RHH family protein
MGAQAGNADGTTPSGDNNDDSTPSNRDVKNHPLFQKMASEYSEMKKRFDAIDAAEAERAQKAAEAEKDYAKATQLAVDKALKAAKDEWAAEQAIKDARAEARFQLVKAGFKNDKFIRGLLDDFDSTKGSAEEFAKAAAADKENAMFLEVPVSKKSGTNPDPPAPPAGQKKRMSDEEIVRLSASEKAEERRAAHLAARMKWIEENQGKAI